MNDNRNKDVEVPCTVSNSFSVNLSESTLKRTMCGVGYWGSDDVNCHSKSYIRWHDMIHRCYNKKFHERQPQYKGCMVCEEWKNYGNFKKWYDANYYSIDNEQMDLDKDILFKGNKIYSPETCCIVPHSINTLFINCKQKRGELPIGVHFDNNKKRYRAQMNYLGKMTKLGIFKDPITAFKKYKEHKEYLIKDIAEKYKDKIPHKAYRAMIEWKIEIDD